MITFAFDIYGTLIDTNGVMVALEKHIGDKAAEFSRVWRDKQLEYSFRRGLMQNYKDFSFCTREALEYTCLYLQHDLSTEIKQGLMEQYRKLPAFTDVQNGLQQVRATGAKIYGFSNGTAEMVEGLLQQAGIRELFDGVVSVDELRSYKPNPAAYCYFLRTADTDSQSAWLVSSNAFDVIGAKSAGMHAVWVKRSQGAVFDPWGIEPDYTISRIEELKEIISK